MRTYFGIGVLVLVFLMGGFSLTRLTNDSPLEKFRCRFCNGSGFKSGTNFECMYCKGTGKTG